MSERESEFIKWLSIIGGSLVTAILIGAFVFYAATISAQAAQEQKNKALELRIQNQEIKTEIMRVEWREDFKEVIMNIDAIREVQVRDRYNNEKIIR